MSINTPTKDKYIFLIKTMKEIATEMDNLGYAARKNTNKTYKAREYFDAANKLRDAANSLEYAIS